MGGPLSIFLLLIIPLCSTTGVCQDSRSYLEACKHLKIEQWPATKSRIVLKGKGGNLQLGSCSFHNSPSLETIVFQKIASLNCKTLIITQNAILGELPTDKMDVTESIVIRHNPSLTKKDLLWAEKKQREIRARNPNAVTYVQEEGECGFPNPIKDTSELLSDCLFINGPMVFAENAIQSWPWRSPQIKKVKDSLVINKTQLTSVAFLKNTELQWSKTSIVNNPLLCDAEHYFQGKGVTLSNNCQDTCRTFRDLVNGDVCSILLDDLLISKNASSNVLKKIKKLKIVKGVVKVIDTDFTKIDFLENLEEIKQPWALGPVLVITDNRHLEEINLPNLKIVESGVTEHIRILYNGDFKVSKDLFKRLENTVDSEYAIMADVDEQEEEDFTDDESHESEYNNGNVEVEPEGELDAFGTTFIVIPILTGMLITSSVAMNAYRVNKRKKVRAILKKMKLLGSRESNEQLMLVDALDVSEADRKNGMDSWDIESPKKELPNKETPESRTSGSSVTSATSRKESECEKKGEGAKKKSEK